MDRIEASDRGAIEHGRCVEENIIEAQERDPFEQPASPSDGSFAVGANRADDLDARQRG
jgi:hypothetical protein